MPCEFWIKTKSHTKNIFMNVTDLWTAFRLHKNSDSRRNGYLKPSLLREKASNIIPVAEELNLKAAAAAVGEKSVEMIHVKDINAITGYIRGGCSPIGMKKQFKTVADSSAKNFDEIIFSGGRLGAQIEMNPNELADLINMDFADIIK